MQVDYKRDMNHSYMIVREEKEPDIASYQIRMLQTNSIDGLLACRIQKMNAQMLYYYDISARQDLKTAYEHRQIGYQTIRLLFEQLIEVMEELEGYLLDPEGLLLSPNMVYFASEPMKAAFCYLPGSRQSIREQMRSLMEYLLPKMDHREAEAVVLGYGLYREISSEEWSVESIKSILLRKPQVPEREEASENREEAEETDEDRKKKAMEAFFGEEEEEEKESPFWTLFAAAGGIGIFGLLLFLMYLTGVPPVMYLILLGTAGVSVSVLILWMKRKEETDTEKEMQSFLIHEEESDGAEDIEETEQEQEAVSGWDQRKEKDGRFVQKPETMFCEPEGSRSSGSSLPGVRKQISPRQLYEKTEPLYQCRREDSVCLVPVSHRDLPIITVSEQEITVGKLEAVVDAALPVPTVSRIHAKLQYKDGICLVTDLNSRNGTYVNGVLLKGEVPKQLEDGDEVAFADIRYQLGRK